MKILFIPSWYPSLISNNLVSGTFVKEHVLSASLNDDVAVLVYRNNGNGFPGVKVDHYIDSSIHTFEARITDSLIPKTNKPFLYINYYKAFRKVTRMWGIPDLLHSQDFSSFYVNWLSKRFSIPFVLSQHWSGFLRRTVNDKQVASFRKSMFNAKFVLPAYFRAGEDYKYYGIKTTIEWMPNAYNTDCFYPSKVPSRSMDLLHVSGFTKEKRVRDIIKAFSISLLSHPNAILHFVGNGPNLSRITDYALSVLPDHSYRFHGHYDKFAVANMMRKCCGLIFPSEFETFGCVLMEAMACGCPVLTTHVGGIPAVVPANEGILVNVGDIEAIAKGINNMLDREHELNLVEIAKHTKERFSRESIGKRLHDVYQKAKSNTY